MVEATIGLIAVADKVVLDTGSVATGTDGVSTDVETNGVEFTTGAVVGAVEERGGFKGGPARGLWWWAPWWRAALRQNDGGKKSQGGQAGG